MFLASIGFEQKWELRNFHRGKSDCKKWFRKLFIILVEVGGWLVSFLDQVDRTVPWLLQFHALLVKFSEVMYGFLLLAEHGHAPTAIWSRYYEWHSTLCINVMAIVYVFSYFFASSMHLWVMMLHSFDGFRPIKKKKIDGFSSQHFILYSIIIIHCKDVRNYVLMLPCLEVSSLNN